VPTIRVFTTDPSFVRSRLSPSTDIYVVGVSSLEHAPSGYSGKYPPDWVGEPAALKDVGSHLRTEPAQAHLSLGVSGRDTLSSREFRDVLTIMADENVDADIFFDPGD
jgi:hypothetical protein